MPEVNPTGLPFKEAIEFFRKKLKIPTERWDDFLGEMHARAFTVAGATKADLLNDLYSDVESAIKNGESIGQFRKRFDETVQKHGWTYKGKRGWRTRTIYDNNLRSASMAGRWEQIQRVKKNRPYLQYRTAGDERVRLVHSQWNNIILLIDDPWWNTHYPPNGFGCRCGIRTLSQRQMERERLTVSEAPEIKLSKRTNASTGQVYRDVPVGIDTSWDYNVGKSYIGSDIAFGEKIMSLPAPLRTQALISAHEVSPLLNVGFDSWVTKAINSKDNIGEIKTLGYMTPDIVDALVLKNKVPVTAVITITDAEIRNANKESKNSKQVPVSSLQNLPELLADPQAILFDKRNNSILYVFDAGVEKRQSKFVVHIDSWAQGSDIPKKLRTNSVRAANIIDKTTLTDANFYEILQGKL